METGSQRFLAEVGRFKAWAASLGAGPHYGEWECDYEHWPELHRYFELFLEQREPAQWTAEETEAVLYAVARDNEVEDMAQTLAKHPRHLFAAAQASLACPEADAKWQLGGVLADVEPGLAQPVLAALAEDADEYVRRRALLDLARLQSPLVEALAEKAWATGHEYQRIAALHALRALRSALLPRFLDAADADGRRYLVENARRIRNEHR